jgi:hypothetical protein
MTGPSNPQRLGTVNGTPLVADVAYLAANEPLVRVTLSVDYVMTDPGGYPERPPAGNASHVNKGLPRTIPAGTVESFLKPEAAALVAAGAAAYS